MRKMVASELVSILREYGYRVSVRDIVENTLSGGKSVSSIVHAVNEDIGSTLIVRIVNNGLSRIHLSLSGDKGFLERIMWSLEDHGFNADIYENTLNVVRRTSLKELVDMVKQILSIISNP